MRSRKCQSSRSAYGRQHLQWMAVSWHRGHSVHYQGSSTHFVKLIGKAFFFHFQQGMRSFSSFCCVSYSDTIDPRERRLRPPQPTSALFFTPYPHSPVDFSSQAPKHHRIHQDPSLRSVVRQFPSNVQQVGLQGVASSNGITRWAPEAIKSAVGCWRISALRKLKIIDLACLDTSLPLAILIHCQKTRLFL
jgi:hypothetical protein